jgi:hypothetical protein
MAQAWVSRNLKKKKVMRQAVATVRSFLASKLLLERPLLFLLKHLACVSLKFLFFMICNTENFLSCYERNDRQCRIDSCAQTTSRKTSSFSLETFTPQASVSLRRFFTENFFWRCTAVIAES